MRLLTTQAYAVASGEATCPRQLRRSAASAGSARQVSAAAFGHRGYALGTLLLVRPAHQALTAGRLRQRRSRRSRTQGHFPAPRPECAPTCLCPGVRVLKVPPRPDPLALPPAPQDANTRHSPDRKGPFHPLTLGEAQSLLIRDFTEKLDARLAPGRKPLASGQHPGRLAATPRRRRRPRQRPR